MEAASRHFQQQRACPHQLSHHGVFVMKAAKERGSHHCGINLANHLVDVSRNKQNFNRLPDIFWGYFARGHDNKDRKFGVIFTYSEREKDIDELIKMYEQWAKNQESENKNE